MTTVMHLNAGDYVSGCAIHDAGNSLNILGSSNGTQLAYMSAQWIAP